MTKVNEFGSEKRLGKRKELVKKVQKKTNELINFKLAFLLNEDIPIDELAYEHHIEILIDKFDQTFTSAKDKMIARNHLSEVINDGNKQGKWLLPVPPYIIRSQKQNTFRTKDWFIHCNELHAWSEVWLRNIDSEPAIESAIEPTEELALESGKEPAIKFTKESKLLASVLISASFYGALCIPEMLTALANSLRLDERPLLVCGELVWLDLKRLCTSQANNIREEEEEKTLRRWYPDPTSLSLIHKYLIERKNFAIKDLVPIKKNSCWRIIREYIDSIDKDSVPSVNSFNHFCKASIGITETVSSYHISQAMAEYAIGTVPCASLTSEFQNALFQPINQKTIEYNLQKLSKNRNLASRESNSDALQVMNYELLYSTIKKALKINSSVGIKNNKEDAIDKLIHIKTQNLPYPILLIVEWLQWMLERKVEEIELVSVSRYFSAIGKVWMANTINLDVSSLEEHDWEQLYLEMLNVETTEKNRSYMAVRFNNMHLFLARNYQIPFLQNSPSSNVSTVKEFVRTGFVTESHFSDLCKSVALMDILNITDDLFNQGLVCILTIVYRAGLRNSEALKLRMTDVGLCEERWITVRENKYGNNKSYSAYRQLPLATLLLPEELKIFNNYIAKRKMILGTDKNGLLFSLPNTPFVPIEGRVFSNIVKTILSSLTGLPVVFYHLRHSALSKLQVVLENDTILINELTRYSSSQVNRIQRFFSHADNDMLRQDIYWSLAGIAGHLTPQTTFANYLHFTDRLLANKINSPTQTFSKNQIKVITGLSLNVITRTFNKLKDDDHKILIQDLNHVIRKNLTPFCTKIKSDRVEAPISNDDKNIISIRSEVKLTVERCLAVLKKVEEGATITELHLDFQIKEPVLEKWIKKAKELSELKTSKGMPRLFSRYEVNTLIDLNIVPAEPQSNIEKLEVNKKITVLKEMYKNQKNELMWCIEYFLKNTHSFSSGLVFKNPDEFKKFFKSMLQVYPVNRWKVIHTRLHTISQEEHTKAWRLVGLKYNFEFSKNVVKRKSTFEFGKVELFLTHPDENTLIEQKNLRGTKKIKKYSSNSLSYLLHMLAIMI